MYQVVCVKDKFYSQSGFEWLVPFAFKGQNKSDQDLYFTLLYFSPDFGIEVYFNEPVPKKSQEFVMVDQYGLNPREKDMVIDNFKLIVSTQPLKSYYFTQPDLYSESTRDSVRLPDATKTQDDWLSKEVVVKVVKESYQGA